MFVDAHYVCDRPGCGKTCSEHLMMEPGQRWYQLHVINEKGYRYYDFCSWECVRDTVTEQLEGL